MSGFPRRAALPALAAMLLGGCGFRPLYARGEAGALGPVQDDLAAISVGLIPNRTGQLLRQALQERFERGGIGVARRFDLAVVYAQSGDAVSFQPDASVTRIRTNANAVWTLTSKGLQPIALVTGTARAVDGFDIINNQYFNVDLNTDASNKRLAETMADQVTLQIAAYFRRHPDAS